MDQSFFIKQFERELSFLKDCHIKGVRELPYILSELHFDSDPEVTVIFNDQFELVFDKKSQKSNLRTNNSHQLLATETIKHLIFVDQLKNGIAYYLKKLWNREEL